MDATALITLVQNYGPFGLTLATFIAYSIIPFPSEAVIIAATAVMNPYKIFLFAIIGAILGGILNYYIGYGGIHLYRKWRNKKMPPKGEGKAEKTFHKYGPISLLLFGWVPVIGDPLVIASGALRLDFKKFFIYSTTGRAIYIAILITIGHAIF